MIDLHLNMGNSRLIASEILDQPCQGIHKGIDSVKNGKLCFGSDLYLQQPGPMITLGHTLAQLRL